MKVRTIEEKQYFSDRLQAQLKVEECMRDSKIQRVWFTDRVWMQDDPKRFEVIIMWEEQ